MRDNEDPRTGARLGFIGNYGFQYLLSSLYESEPRSKHAPYMPSASLENAGQLAGEPEQTTTRLPEARGGAYSGEK